MTDDAELAAEDRPSSLVVRLDLNPDAAKILDHLMAERLRIIAAEIAQHPPVHTRRVLDLHVEEITSARVALKLAIANPLSVPVPGLGGGE